MAEKMKNSVNVSSTLEKNERYWAMQKKMKPIYDAAIASCEGVWLAHLFLGLLAFGFAVNNEITWGYFGILQGSLVVCDIGAFLIRAWCKLRIWRINARNRE